MVQRLLICQEHIARGVKPAQIDFDGCQAMSRPVPAAGGQVAKTGAKTQTAARLVEGVATEQAQETAIAASPGASGGLPQRRTLLLLVESIAPMMLRDNVWK